MQNFHDMRTAYIHVTEKRNNGQVLTREDREILLSGGIAVSALLHDYNVSGTLKEDRDLAAAFFRAGIRHNRAKEVIDNPDALRFYHAFVVWHWFSRMKKDSVCYTLECGAKSRGLVNGWAYVLRACYGLYGTFSLAIIIEKMDDDRAFVWIPLYGGRIVHFQFAELGVFLDTIKRSRTFCSADIIYIT